MYGEKTISEAREHADKICLARSVADVTENRGEEQQRRRQGSSSRIDSVVR